jgi:hypothetical protein
VQRNGEYGCPRNLFRIHDQEWKSIAGPQADDQGIKKKEDKKRDME